MDFQVVDIDFNKEWMDRREALVKYALLSLEEERQHQIKVGKTRINGIFLIAAIIIIATYVLYALFAKVLWSWFLKVIISSLIIFLVLTLIFIIYHLMIDYTVLDENNRESNFTELSILLKELLTCTEIENAYSAIEKVSNLIDTWQKGFVWKTPEVSHLKNMLSSLWNGYSLFCNTILESRMSDKKYKPGIILTYADKNGDVYEEFHECEFRNNINVETDTLTWENGELVYIKKYKQ